MKASTLLREINMDSLLNVNKHTKTFIYDAYEFIKDYYLQKYLEKMFDAEYEAVWRSNRYSLIINKDKLDWNCCAIIILKKNGNYVCMENSEWASFTNIRGDKL